MRRSPHSFGRLLLKSLFLFGLVLAAPLGLLLLVPNPVRGEAREILRQATQAASLSAAPLFRSDAVLIGGTALFVIVAVAMIALMRAQTRRHRRQNLAPGYGHPERNGDVPTVPPSPDLTFHQCAMKIQFKLTHLEEKVNDLETVLMRRAADPE